MFPRNQNTPWSCRTVLSLLDLQVLVQNQDTQRMKDANLLQRFSDRLRTSSTRNSQLHADTCRKKEWGSLIGLATFEGHGGPYFGCQRSLLPFATIGIARLAAHTRKKGSNSFAGLFKRFFGVGRALILHRRTTGERKLQQKQIMELTTVAAQVMT